MQDLFHKNAIDHFRRRMGIPLWFTTQSPNPTAVWGSGESTLKICHTMDQLVLSS